MAKKNLARVGLLAVLTPFSFACAGDAASSTLKVSGTLETQYGFVTQSAPFRYKQPGKADSGKLARGSLVNKTRLKFDWDAVAESGLKYGAVIKLRTDTYEKGGRIGDKIYAYTEGSFGSVQVGSHVGLSITMRQSASEIAKANGGIDGEVSKWFQKRTLTNDGILNQADPVDAFVELESAFVSSPALPIGAVQRIDAAKITYFTPEFAGLKFGVSYIPDVEIHGTVAQASKTTGYVGKGDGFSFKNVVEGGLNYTLQLADFKITTGLLGQFGEAKQPDPNDNTTGNKYINPLRAWEIGGKAEYKEWAIAGSYGDWGKSVTPKERVPGNKYGAKYWTAGVAYQLDKFGASLTYFGSKRAGGMYKGYAVSNTEYNKLSLVSLGMEYKLVPGLMTYVEMNWFRHNGKGAEGLNKGSVLLIGSKLSF